MPNICNTRLLVVPCVPVIRLVSVSYTHLDVYKRQVIDDSMWAVLFYTNKKLIFEEEKFTQCFSIIVVLN